MSIGMGPITGMKGVASELVAHLGYDPGEYPDLVLELDALIGEELLDIGRQVFAERGLPVRDWTGWGS